MRNVPLVLLACISVLGGCRTYGGYDSKELNIEALSDLTEQVASSATLAEAELTMLQEASRSDASLQAHAEVFSMFVEHHRELANRLTDHESPAGYLSTSRALGAVISELNIVRDGYADVKVKIAESRGATIERTNTGDDIAYSDVPPYFRRIRLNQDLSMRDVLTMSN
ncbi:MAG: hypothetical protein HKN43_05440 [Rhodothermales bacterium]|nr:hypothetical protein [Rhodothermales bacterium]